MKCPKCGDENPPGSQFCGECGTILVQPQQQQPEFNQSVPPPDPTLQNRYDYPPVQNQVVPTQNRNFQPQAAPSSGGIIRILPVILAALALLIMVGGTISAFFEGDTNAWIGAISICYTPGVLLLIAAAAIYYYTRRK